MQDSWKEGPDRSVASRAETYRGKVINSKGTNKTDIAQVRWEKWNWCADTENERQVLSQYLEFTDILISRGTDPKHPCALVDFIDAPHNQMLKEKLQWRVMENRTLYVGVCGGSKLAGAQLFVGKTVREGLGLFGKYVDVHGELVAEGSVFPLATANGDGYTELGSFFNEGNETFIVGCKVLMTGVNFEATHAVVADVGFEVGDGSRVGQWID